MLGRPLWTAGPEDADRFLSSQRKLGLAGNTVYGKAGRIGRLYDTASLAVVRSVLDALGIADDDLTTEQYTDAVAAVR